jgi:hypothetical protein
LLEKIRCHQHNSATGIAGISTFPALFCCNLWLCVLSCFTESQRRNHWLVFKSIFLLWTSHKLALGGIIDLFLSPRFQAVSTISVLTNIYWQHLSSSLIANKMLY